MTAVATTLEQRFWAKVDRRGPDECWLWTAARNSNGYGVIRTPDGLVLAHRFSVMIDGRDPSIATRHSCDTPACVNPAHLTGGTQGENMRDGASRGRINRGAANPNAVLSDEIVREIRRLADDGTPFAVIARRLGLKREAVSLAARRVTWAHVA